MFTNDPFEDFGFGFGTPFSSPYESRRRQAELARRQRLDAESRRQLDLERRRQYMERERAKEEQRRRELEMMRRQQLIEEEEMRRKKAAAQKRRARTYKPGTVVLGPDGNLYRVISPTNDARLPSEEVKRTEHKKDRRFSGSNQESKENRDEQMLPAKEVEESYEEESSVSSTTLDYMNDDYANHTHEDHIHVASESNAEQEAIVVEDVDDEEDDELRELHSIWRNRSPSPGQWIEPIDKYDEQHV